jgi:hypothetical protein
MDFELCIHYIHPGPEKRTVRKKDREKKGQYEKIFETIFKAIFQQFTHLRLIMPLQNYGLKREAKSDPKK